jgi:hypothetical protein
VTAAVFRRGAVEVRGCAGALWIARGGEAILLDAPSGVERAIFGLPAVRGLLALALSGGRIASVGGMLPLLCALDDARRDDAPLLVWSPMGDERPGLVLEAWNRGWPCRFGVTVESEAPGSEFTVGPFQVTTFPMRRLEPSVRSSSASGMSRGSGVPAAAAAFRVSVDGCVVAFVPGAANAGLVRHVCRGADLAVIEVGALSIADTIASVEKVGEAWLLGPDGELVGGDPT